MLKFSDVVDLYTVRRAVQAKFSCAFLDLFSYVQSTYEDTRKYKQQTIDKVNYLLYTLYTDGTVPYDWDEVISSSSFSFHPNDMEKVLRGDAIQVNDVCWDIHSTERENIGKSVIGSLSSDPRHKIPDPVADVPADDNSLKVAAVSNETKKEDLFICFPKYPQVSNSVHSETGLIKSLPFVPSKQCEISCTTDVESLTSSDLAKLYPDRLIRTRSEYMYRPRDGMTLDPDYGLLVPVHGFSDAEVRDCVIRYPHIFKLRRLDENGNVTSFYNHIEIDGELVDVYEAWKFLPESAVFDIDSLESVEEKREFVKEYAIRRYLLERDVLGVKHKYPVMGDLSEFVTLFMPAYMYEREGYGTASEVARKCVESRVRYLRSRNPKINSKYHVDRCVFEPFCTQKVCDRACARWAQSDYLMMRNNVRPSSPSFSMGEREVLRYDKLYRMCLGKTSVVQTSDTVTVSERMSYVMVFNCWQNSAMRVKCYSMSFSSYVQSLQQSWSEGKSDDFQYQEIWSRSSQVLLVSGMDYVNFKDFQCQVVLQLVQDRERDGKTTVIVVPSVDRLVGSGSMFNLFVSKLRDCSVNFSM